MAESTVELVKTAWLQVIIAVIIIFLLYKTLVYTRRAVEETEKGTKAMRATVKVTRDVGEAQTRAYVHIVRSRIIMDERSISVISSYKNTGLSPAKDMKITIYVGYSIGETLRIPKIFFTKEKFPRNIASGFV